MAQAISFASTTIADNTQKSNGEPETTSYQIAITTMTPANAAGIVTALGNLNTAIAPFVLGRFLKNELTYSRVSNGAQIPADSELAQRENKWLMRYHDDVTFEKFTISIGTADLTKKVPHSEFVDLSAGDGLALATAWHALVVSPNNPSNATTLDSMQFVGRNT